jgi:hypothetical protein
MSKFATIKVGEFFYLSSSKPSFTLPGLNIKFQVHSLDAGEQACRKSSAVTYVNLAEPLLGELAYSPNLESRILTLAEKQEESAIQAPAAPALAPVNKPAAPKKKTSAKKSAPKKAVKPAKKSAPKKPILPPDRVAGNPVAKKSAKKGSKKR